MYIPWFLEFLGLDVDADRKAIKRSYAMLLKGVDQKGNIEGFEKLRNAYEAAIDWEKKTKSSSFLSSSLDGFLSNDDREFIEKEKLSFTSEEDEHIFLPKETEALEEKELTKNESLARSLHISFDEELQSLISDWTSTVQKLVLQEDVAEEVLRKILQGALSDDRLVNLGNRYEFERYLMHSFRNISTPFRAISFMEASRVYGWGDLLRLEESEDGRWVLRVLDEKKLWEEQKPKILDLQKKAMNSYVLREFKLEKNYNYWNALDRMHEAYPTWFALWVDARHFEYVKNSYSEYLKEQSENDKTQYRKAWVAFVFIAFIFAISLSNPFDKSKIKNERSNFNVSEKRIEKRELDVPSSISYFSGKTINGKTCGKLEVFVGVTGNDFEKVAQESLRKCMLYSFWRSDEKTIQDLWDFAENHKIEDSSIAPLPLAYEFKGAAKLETCELASEFAHHSNWREINDLVAKEKLEKFILKCVDSNFWPGGEKEIIATLVRTIVDKKK